MKRLKTRLSLRTDTIRQLSRALLDEFPVAGARWTAPDFCGIHGLRPDTRASEQQGEGPCPGQYSHTCQTG
jgi:hypothetical protein